MVLKNDFSINVVNPFLRQFVSLTRNEYYQGKLSIDNNEKITDFNFNGASFPFIRTITTNEGRLFIIISSIIKG